MPGARTLPGAGAGRPPSQFALFEATIETGAIVTGLAAALFTGTPWVPVAYLGAFAWGAGGTVFYTVAATALQRLAPAGMLGRVAGVISTTESATETVAMPAAGALVAVAGLRPAHSP